MSTIVTRAGKGSALTFAEADANFTNLNADKIEFAGGNMTGGINSARGNIPQHATNMDFFAVTSPDILDGTGGALTITGFVAAPQAGATRTFYPIAGTVLTHGATFDIAGNVNLIASAGDGWEMETKTTTTCRVSVVKEYGAAVRNIKDFGAVGDGVTNDSAALTAAIAALTNGGGTIFFPAGDYILSSAVLIEPAGADAFISNIHFKGVGGHHTNIATRIQLNGGSAGTAGMTLKSAVQMSFEDIDFIGATSMLALIKIQADGAIPAYSSFNIAFRNCRFATTTPVQATMWINNSSNVSFEQCFFQGATIAVQLGSNTADAENTGTFSTGLAAQVEFAQCFFNGDIVSYRSQMALFNSCVFDLNAAAGTRGARIYAAGDQMVRGMHLMNCWAGYGDDTAVFLTLGTAGSDLTVVNSFFATYVKGIVLNGTGVAHIEGNEFALASSGAVAVDIDVATFYGANVQNNLYTGMHATSYFVNDARANPGTPPTLAPIEVNANRTGDYTITNHGTGYEDCLTASVKLTGGNYRIQGAVTITTGATASVFKARINTDASTPRVSGLLYIPASSQGTICMSRDVCLDGTTGSTTARLQIYQVTGGTGATVEATDTVNTTMMQFTRMNG